MIDHREKSLKRTKSNLINGYPSIKNYIFLNWNEVWYEKIKKWKIWYDKVELRTGFIIKGRQNYIISHFTLVLDHFSAESVWKPIPFYDLSHM